MAVGRRLAVSIFHRDSRSPSHDAAKPQNRQALRLATKPAARRDAATRPQRLKLLPVDHFSHFSHLGPHRLTLW